VCGHQLLIHCGEQILIAANEGQALITIGNEKIRTRDLVFGRLQACLFGIDSTPTGAGLNRRKWCRFILPLTRGGCFGRCGEMNGFWTYHNATSHALAYVHHVFSLVAACTTTGPATGCRKGRAAASGLLDAAWKPCAWDHYRSQP
jgi:hypothetical protein